MGTLQEGARIAVRTCMRIKEGEHVLIVTDRPTLEVSRAIEDAVREITHDIKVFVLEDYGKRPLKEMPQDIRDSIPWANATFWIALGIGNELKTVRAPFRKEAVRHVRVHGHMMAIPKKIMEQGMCVDYEKISELSHNVYDIIKAAKTARIVCPNGTDIRIEFNPNWKWGISDGLVYKNPNKWNNLPDGEVWTAAHKVDGRIVTMELGDWFSEKYGDISKTPVSFEIKNSRIDLSTVKCKSEKIKTELLEYLKTDENSNRASEFALPTNIELLKRPLIGNLLQDEKARTHIAFGDPYPDETGADWSSSTHVDCLIEHGKVWFDGRLVLENGVYRLLKN